MSDEELLESLERHFLIGNAGLTRTQFGEHAGRGSCTECDEIASEAAELARGARPLAARG